MRSRAHLGRRVFVPWLVAVTLLAATPVAAQDPRDPPGLDLQAALASSPLTQRVQLLPVSATEAKRPAALMPLYVSLIGLQGLDIHSSRQGMRSGATRESNPLMKPFVGNDAAFIAMKASATAGTIFVTEKLRKKRPKTAVVLVAALNAGMAAIVAHNYRLSRGR